MVSWQSSLRIESHFNGEIQGSGTGIHGVKVAPEVQPEGVEGCGSALLSPGNSLHNYSKLCSYGAQLNKPLPPNMDKIQSFS